MYGVFLFRCCCCWYVVLYLENIIWCVGSYVNMWISCRHQTATRGLCVWRECMQYVCVCVCVFARLHLYMNPCHKFYTNFQIAIFTLVIWYCLKTYLKQLQQLAWAHIQIYFGTRSAGIRWHIGEFLMYLPFYSYFFIYEVIHSFVFVLAGMVEKVSKWLLW